MAVTFNEPEFETASQKPTREKGLTAWVIRNKLVKNKTEAARFFLIITVVAVIVAIALIVVTSEKPVAPIPF